MFFLKYTVRFLTKSRNPLNIPLQHLNDIFILAKFCMMLLSSQYMDVNMIHFLIIASHKILLNYTAFVTFRSLRSVSMSDILERDIRFCKVM